MSQLTITNNLILDEKSSLSDQLKVFVLSMLKTLLETILNTEFEEKRRGLKVKGVFQRNGTYTRSLVTEWGLIKDLVVHRFRKRKFFCSLFAPRQRRLPTVDLLLTKLFIQGESYRDLRRVVQCFLGDTISLATLSRITNKVLGIVSAFHRRPLTDPYEVLWIDGMYVPMKEPSQRKKKGKNRVILAVLGLNAVTHKKELIDYLPAFSENQWAYKQLLRSLLRRGLQVGQIKMVVHDGEEAIIAAVRDVFGSHLPQQNCIFHKLQNITKAVQQKEFKEVIQTEAAFIYQAPTLEDYCARRQSFVARYRRRESRFIGIACILDDDFIVTKYQLPQEYFHLVQTTNPLDRTFREVRRRTNIIGCFEHQHSLDKILFLTINFINQLFGNVSFAPQLNLTHN